MHVEAATMCQDWCDWAFVEPYLVAAVADGAGSATRSALGAELACETALETVSIQLAGSSPNPAEAVSSAMHTARDRLLAEALSSGEPESAYACTLLVAAAGPEGLFVNHVGDGCCVVEHESGVLETLSEPVNGEYINVTAFITDSDAMDHVAVGAVTAVINGWALLTDGLYDMAVDRRQHTPHAGFFRPILDAVTRNPSDFSPQLAQWLRSERVAARTSDDVTLFVAARCSE
ncbi:MAG: protein phosphatase 2C domain-containing protein [Armatimonadetes bacterium]|nr:protein phosphatase 2C domain-containing protein [Armatimonadota bacterium]MDE2206002.1 protein phosphatase 2C domain-containing protein [Armatimonadota bacterium]